MTLPLRVGTMDTPRLQLTHSQQHENEIIQAHIRRQAAPGQRLRILEAGCGQKWPLDLSGVNYELTGVDLDGDALQIRVDRRKDLDKAIVSDLRSVEFEPSWFDVIVSFFVLEHVSGAELVLRNFERWLKTGGLIILRIPDPLSVHGFITRVTPHWFHVFYYRRVLRRKNAGMPGYAPYPVFYDHVIGRRGMREFCERSGLAIVAEFGDGHVRPGSGVVKAMIHGLKSTIGLLSLGHLSHRHTNLLFILRKQR